MPKPETSIANDKKANDIIFGHSNRLQSAQALMNQDVCALWKLHEEELKTADNARKDEIHTQWAKIFAGIDQLAVVYKNISDVAFRAAIRSDRHHTPL
jgi:hypothetical protein